VPDREDPEEWRRDGGVDGSGWVWINPGMQCGQDGEEAERGGIQYRSAGWMVFFTRSWWEVLDGEWKISTNPQGLLLLPKWAKRR